tara:strand:+ start:881 stop:1363 length:483 start_codon:yes stop_codon:yes gene_type:complete
MSNTTGTAKVVSVTDTGKVWKDFKKITVVLDNGVEGVANAKNFPPPYNAGDEVEYEANENQYGILLKVKRADSGDFAAQHGSPTTVPHKPEIASSYQQKQVASDTRSNDIQVGQSVNLAVETLAASVWKESFDNDKYVEQVKYMAKEFYAILADLKTELK